METVFGHIDFDASNTQRLAFHSSFSSDQASFVDVLLPLVDGDEVAGLAAAASRADISGANTTTRAPR